MDEGARERLETIKRTATVKMEEERKQSHLRHHDAPHLDITGPQFWGSIVFSLVMIVWIVLASFTILATEENHGSSDNHSSLGTHESFDCVDVFVLDFNKTLEVCDYDSATSGHP